MSLKYEQFRALHRTRQFLSRCMLTPRLTAKELREQASRCLRHYPFLDSRGCPMFSSDEFECPIIDKEAK